MSVDIYFSYFNISFANSNDILVYMISINETCIEIVAKEFLKLLYEDVILKNGGND